MIASKISLNQIFRSFGDFRGHVSSWIITENRNTHTMASEMKTIGWSVTIIVRFVLTVSSLKEDVEDIVPFQV